MAKIAESDAPQGSVAIWAQNDHSRPKPNYGPGSTRRRPSFGRLWSIWAQVGDQFGPKLLGVMVCQLFLGLQGFLDFRILYAEFWVKMAILDAYTRRPTWGLHVLFWKAPHVISRKWPFWANPTPLWGRSFLGPFLGQKCVHRSILGPNLGP